MSKCLEVRRGDNRMNKQYYEVCKSIFGQYTKDNQYEYQLLYLVCYLGNIDSVRQICKLKRAVKKLYSKTRRGKDLLHDILLRELREAKKGKKSLFSEDFLVRGILYYNEICYNEKSGDIDSRIGRKRQITILWRLSIICCFYDMLIGVNKNVLEEEACYWQNGCITEKVCKENRTGKNVKELENKIREGIYSRIRDKVIHTRKKR